MNANTAGTLNERESTKFPSRYAIDELVDLDFGNSKYLKSVKIKAVHFTESKVFYDIEIPFGYEETTIIQMVDSIIVVDCIE